ncbi:MAG: cyclic nucleotide-binding domain-containing protein [Thermodesulfobacteriota bacterium]
MTENEALEKALEDRLDVAREVDLFADLIPEELESIAALMIPVVFRSGQVIMKEGEMGHSMYVVAKGSVQVNKALTMKFGQDDYRETEKTLIVLRGEDHPVIGEMSLVTESERSATATSMTECLLYEIDKNDFLTMAQSNPSLAFKVTLKIAGILSQRLKKANDDAIRLTTALSIALSR